MHLKIQEVLMSTLYTFKDGGMYLFYNLKNALNSKNGKLKKRINTFFIG